MCRRKWSNRNQNCCRSFDSCWHSRAECWPWIDSCWHRKRNCWHRNGNCWHRNREGCRRNRICWHRTQSCWPYPPTSRSGRGASDGTRGRELADDREVRHRSTSSRSGGRAAPLWLYWTECCQERPPNPTGEPQSCHPPTTSQHNPCKGEVQKGFCHAQGTRRIPLGRPDVSRIEALGGGTA